MKEDKEINHLKSTKTAKIRIMILTSAVIILLISFSVITIIHLFNKKISSDASASDVLTSANITESAATVTPIIKPAEHLDLYNDFGWINASEYFKGFIISEKKMNGELYYQLYNQKKDIIILVDRSEQEATIQYNGKSMNFNMQYLVAAGGYTSIDLLDITGDGEEELIISHGGGGAGFYEGTCEVYDLTTMTKYNIDEYINDLCSKVKVETLKEIHNHQILCKVTDTKGNVYYGTISAAISDRLSDYTFQPENYDNYYTIGVNKEQHCLEVSIGIDMDDRGHCYLGTISSYMVYDKNDNRFVLSDTYSVKIDSIAEGYYYDSSTSETVESLKERLLDNIIAINNKYNDFMIETVADDFNNDGQQEFFYLFAYPGASKEDNYNYKVDLWFGNSNGVKRILENDYINPNTYGRIEVAERNYFRYDIVYGTGSTSHLLEVRNNQCREYFIACGSIHFYEDSNDFTVLYDCYDMLYDKQEKYFLGHTWKNYYYYADSKGFHEYGAKEIKHKEFLKYQNAANILKGIDKMYGKGEKITLQFYIRSNGLVHINISCEDEERISCYYKTYRINGKKLEEFDDGEGSYMDALTPEMAVY